LEKRGNCTGNRPKTTHLANVAGTHHRTENKSLFMPLNSKKFAKKQGLNGKQRGKHGKQSKTNLLTKKHIKTQLNSKQNIFTPPHNTYLQNSKRKKSSKTTFLPKT
jgi:hypothetical protein